MRTMMQKNDWHKNERGFTLIELLVASALSVLMIALVAGIFQSQNNTFVLENQLNKMQTNGRATTEFLSRAVQNAGYNVFRGTRFLAASDHYLTAVYDQNNDGIIQNNEVMTFTVGNNFSAVDETINIDPFFDMDQNGAVDGTETATFPITMTLTGPPYNLYKVIPDNVGTGFTRNTVARDVENLMIRYYDKNGNMLPAQYDTDADDIPDTALDADNNGIPDTGTYVLALADLNNIRKVDIQVVARTRDQDPREAFNDVGAYFAGSVATEMAAGYNDRYHRQTFTANSAPRNLVMAPWGKMDIAANPKTVACPVSTANITATLADSNGTPVAAGTTVSFTASGDTTTTLSAVSDTTNAFGEATTTLSYDWTSPNSTITLSASALITVGGEQNPVFNAIPVEFQSGTGTFSDTFTGGLDPDWVEVNGATMGPVDTDADTIDDAYQMQSFNFNSSVNGCAWQNFQAEFEMTPDANLTEDRFVGGYIRYEDANNNYSALIYRDTGVCFANAVPKNYCLRIVKWNGAVIPLAGIGIGVDFVPGTKYKILTQAEGTDLRAKIWDADALGLADPNPGVWAYDSVGFPGVYPLTAVDADYASGQIGLLGSFNNGENVVFDNYTTSAIP